MHVTKHNCLLTLIPKNKQRDTSILKWITTERWGPEMKILLLTVIFIRQVGRPAGQRMSLCVLTTALRYTSCTGHVFVRMLCPCCRTEVFTPVNKLGLHPTSPNLQQLPYRITSRKEKICITFSPQIQSIYTQLKKECLGSRGGLTVGVILMVATITFL
jgi:hypothetical protein